MTNLIVNTLAWTPDPIAFTLFGKDFYWYGIIIATAVLIGILIAMRIANEQGYHTDLVADITFIALPLGIIGARLMYCLTYTNESTGINPYLANPLLMLRVWEGGLMIYGGVFLALLGIILYSRRKHINLGDILDIACVALILGQAMGRWGNFINGEAFGRLITNPNWQFFPFAVYIRAAGSPYAAIDGYYMATFFYESLWNFITLAALLMFRRHRKLSGEMVNIYVIMYAFIRIITEGLRTDAAMIGAFRVNQVISGLLLVAGIIIFLVRRERASVTGEYNLGFLKDSKYLLTSDEIKEIKTKKGFKFNKDVEENLNLINIEKEAKEEKAETENQDDETSAADNEDIKEVNEEDLEKEIPEEDDNKEKEETKEEKDLENNL